MFVAFREDEKIQCKNSICFHQSNAYRKLMGRLTELLEDNKNVHDMDPYEIDTFVSALLRIMEQ